MKNTFVTTEHKPILEFKILAAPIGSSEEFKEMEITGQNFKLAVIPKKNIGVDPTYQRKYQKAQINNIHKNWDYDLYEPVAIYKYQDKKTGLTYYQATDGQHRLCAHPKEEVLCRIVNSKAAVTRCLEANDTKTKSGWSVDDRFWARKTELERVEGKEDKDFVRFTIEAFEKAGFNPCHPKKKAPRDIGGKIATVHSYFEKSINKNIRTRDELSEDEQAQLAETAILDTISIMKDLFQPNFVQYQGRIWAALFDWLTNSNHLDCAYDVGQVFVALNAGLFKFKNARNYTQANDAVSIRHAASVAIAKRFVTDRQHQAIIWVFDKIHSESLALR